MCELKAYLRKKDGEELILESVSQAKTEGDAVVLRNLFGEEKRIPGVLKEISLTKNRLVVERT